MLVATIIDSGRIVRNQLTERWWAEFIEPPVKIKEPGYKGGKNKAGWHPKITECSQCHSLQSPQHQSSIPLDPAPVTPGKLPLPPPPLSITRMDCPQSPIL